MGEFPFDSSLDFSDSLPPLLFTGDCQCAEEIPDHEVCHPGDTHCKDERLSLTLSSLFVLDSCVTFRSKDFALRLRMLFNYVSLVIGFQIFVASSRNKCRPVTLQFYKYIEVGQSCLRKESISFTFL